MTAVLASQGLPFIVAGDEVMRSKFGVANSYASPDSITAIDWRNKTAHRDLFDYTCGLIAMRKAHPAFRMGDAERVRRHLKFLDTPSDNVVAFRIEGNPCGDAWANVTVALNAGASPAAVEVPEGEYRVVCRDGKIDAAAGLGMVKGNVLAVSPRSALIVHQ